MSALNWFRAGAFAALFFVGSASGQEKRDPAALYESLREVINNGADLFNQQADYAGCYRLYQGSLLSIKPLLKAELQGEIDTAMIQAEKLPTFADRAFELRKMIDRVREQVKPATPLPVINPVEVVKPVPVVKPVEVVKPAEVKAPEVKLPPANPGPEAIATPPTPLKPMPPKVEAKKKKSREELIRVPPKKIEQKSGIEHRRLPSGEESIEQFLDVRLHDRFGVAIEEAVFAGAFDPIEQSKKEVAGVENSDRLMV